MTAGASSRPEGIAQAGSSRARVAGWLLLLGVALGWGLSWPVSKIALHDIPPWTFRGTAALASGVVLLGLARLGGHPLAMPGALRPVLVLVSMLNIGIWMILTAYGVTLVGAGHTTLLNYTMPLWVAVLSTIFLGERFTARRGLAVALGLASLAVLAGDAAGAIRASPLGAGCILLAAFLWAIGTIVQKRVAWPVPSVTLAGWQAVIGGAPLFLVAAVVELPHLGPVSPPSLLALAYSTLIGMVFCFYAWSKAVLLLPASVAAMGMLMIPVVGLLGSWLLVGEPLGWHEIGALATLLAAVGLVAVPAREK